MNKLKLPISKKAIIFIAALFFVSRFSRSMNARGNVHEALYEGIIGICVVAGICFMSAVYRYYNSPDE